MSKGAIWCFSSPFWHIRTVVVCVTKYKGAIWYLRPLSDIFALCSEQVFSQSCIGCNRFLLGGFIDNSSIVWITHGSSNIYSQTVVQQKDLVGGCTKANVPQGRFKSEPKVWFRCRGRVVSVSVWLSIVKVELVFIWEVCQLKCYQLRFGWSLPIWLEFFRSRS